MVDVNYVGIKMNKFEINFNKQLNNMIKKI